MKSMESDIALPDGDLAPSEVVFSELIDRWLRDGDRLHEAAPALEGTDVAVGAAHFPGMRFGRLLGGTGRRGWRFDA